MRAKLAMFACAAVVACCGTLENMDTTLQMDVDGPVLRLDGIINSRSAGQFADVLEGNPGLRIVEFGRIDGSIDDESVAEMGYILRDAGLATRAVAGSEVYSGGVDLFLAGVDRRVAPGAILGVHEWESGFGRGRDYPRGHRAHEPTRSFIEDMLGSDAFYWFTLDAAAFDEVHVLSRDEMLRFGVVTH